MRSIKRTLAVAITAVALVVGSAFSASAITRSACGSQYLQLFSPNTTCWAYAGTASVNLFSVQGLSSGNNAGYVYSSSFGNDYFAKYAQQNFSATVTVTTVHIN